MSKSRKGGQGLTDLLTIAGLLSLSELTKGKKRVAKKKTGKKKAAKKTISRKKPARKVVKKKKSVSRKKPARKTVNRKKPVKKTVSRRKPAKKVVKRKKPVKKTVSRRKPAKKVVKRKKPVKKVVRRKKGGMMGTLAPHGVSASTAAFALAALSKADMKRKPRKQLKRKPKRKPKRKSRKKGGQCNTCPTGQRGGRSDWKVVQFSRGPANYPNNGWSCGKKQFGTFTKTGQYVPNSQLAWQGWANPQLANTVSSQCK